MLTCLYDVVGYALLGSMCLCVYFLAIWSDPCLHMFLCLYVQTYVFTCLCVQIYVLYILYAIFHVLVCTMPCLCAQTQAMFVMPCAIVVLLSLCFSFLCFGLMVSAVCTMPCLYAQTQAMFVMPCAIIVLLSLCFSFLCFGLMVRARSRPYGLCHCPYTKTHIKGFGSPLFACLCLLASRLCHA